jgi:hypothetical protein
VAGVAVLPGYGSEELFSVDFLIRPFIPVARILTFERSDVCLFPFASVCHLFYLPA